MIAALALLMAADVRASLFIEPRNAQVGEPVVVALVVERPARVAVDVPEIEAGVRGSWMFLETLGTRSAPHPSTPGVVVETTTWRAFALEGGAAAPEIEVAYTAANGLERVRAEGPAPTVAHALAAGEDAPRPAPGFRDPVEWTGGGARLAVLALAALVLVALALSIWIARARRRRAAPATLPSPADELARLAPDSRDPALNRDVVYALTRIARGAVDAFSGERRAARTDLEWLALVEADARVPEPARVAAKRLVERAERVKYAGFDPTHFATDEALSDARAIVEAVAPARSAA